MTQFKENLSVKSIIKPNQSKTIADHEWHDGAITFNSACSNIIDLEFQTFNSHSYQSVSFNKSDALAIANHFNLLPKPIESPFPFMDSQSPAWMAIVEYVLCHEDEIKADVDDYATLEPTLDFFKHANRGMVDVAGVE